MKFIHTADIHWGFSPDSSKPWSRERTQAIKDTFSQIITKARDLEVNFLFISTVFSEEWRCVWKSVQNLRSFALQRI